MKRKKPRFNAKQLFGVGFGFSLILIMYSTWVGNFYLLVGGIALLIPVLLFLLRLHLDEGGIE